MKSIFNRALGFFIKGSRAQRARQEAGARASREMIPRSATSEAPAKPDGTAGASSWRPYGEGRTIGGTGSESGVILSNEETKGGARITLERDCWSSPFAITCGVYGVMVHTSFFTSLEDARNDYGEMKAELERLLDLMASEEAQDDDRTPGWQGAMDKFIERF